MSFYSTDDSANLRAHNRIRPVDVLFWLLIVSAPFISAGLLQILTGTSALRLDAWNTTWNDEVGYVDITVEQSALIERSPLAVHLSLDVA